MVVAEVQEHQDKVTPEETEDHIQMQALVVVAAEAVQVLPAVVLVHRD